MQVTTTTITNIDHINNSATKDILKKNKFFTGEKILMQITPKKVTVSLANTHVAYYVSYF